MKDKYDFRDLIGSVVSFDVARYDFKGAILEKVNEHLKGSGKELSELGKIHEVMEGESYNDLEKAIYEELNSQSFFKMNQAFIQDIISPLFSEELLFQIVPAVRIHFPGRSTVPYHADYWYGHGDNIVNLWLPLTRVYDSNTLWLYKDLDQALKEYERFDAEKVSMDEIDETFKASSLPLEGEFGDCFIFHGLTPHGTHTNKTDDTRVSIDIRCVIKGESMGSKRVGEFYSPVNGFDEKPPQKALSYMQSLNGFTRFITHKQQRIAIEAYAKVNKITTIYEAAEIISLPYNPTLYDWALGRPKYDNDCIVLYSLVCLPIKYEDRKLVYNRVKETGVALHFASEEIIFPEISEEDLEARYTSMQFVG